MSDESEAKKVERLRMVDELTDLVLKDMTERAKAGKLTAAETKVFLDFLAKCGLDLDPRNVPQDLKGLLTSRVKFDDPPDAAELKPRLVG